LWLTHKKCERLNLRALGGQTMTSRRPRSWTNSRIRAGLIALTLATGSGSGGAHDDPRYVGDVGLAVPPPRRTGARLRLEWTGARAERLREVSQIPPVPVSPRTTPALGDHQARTLLGGVGAGEGDLPGYPIGRVLWYRPSL
jgi:hypothetical protein